MSAFNPLRTLAHPPNLGAMDREYVLDGSEITSLDAFYDQIGERLIGRADWGRNLDAFDDILSPEYPTPHEGFTLRWKHSEVSRESLGYPETVRQLEKRLTCCHPTARESVRAQIDQARQEQGATVFDWLVAIIEDHGSAGEQSESKVRLVLD